MAFVGMNVQAIRTLARQFDEAAAEVRALERELTAGLRSTDWRGDDALAFEQRWQSQHARALGQAVDLMRSASALAYRNASQQEATSRNGA